MVFYSTDGRAYTVAIALLLASTLSMLIAVETKRTRWWVAYAAFTALCMYAHYTTAFVLGAQLLWLLWAHPDARKAAILANVGAAIAFLPWLPSMLDDFDSPTIGLLSLLQGDGFGVKRQAVEAWAFGYPYSTPREVPGVVPIVIATAALGIAALVALWRWWTRGGGEDGRPQRRVSRGVVLVFMLALSTPVAELVILGLGGNDLFGARNLNTATPGLALVIGAVAGSAGVVMGTICVVAVLGAFAYGTARSLDQTVETIPLNDASAFIDENSAPDDVVVVMLSAVITPVPLTPLDLYMEGDDHPEYRIYLPKGKPPFLHNSPMPAPLVRDAIAQAETNPDGRLFLVTGPTLVQQGPDGVTLTLPPPPQSEKGETQTITLGPDWQVVDEARWEGISDVLVLELEHQGPPADQ
jgi:hypothetical protein